MVFAQLLALAAALTAPGERTLTKGECPAWSPDGGRIAFQRMRDGTYSLGVADVASGDVTWIEDGSGQAIHPDWSPSGALVYSYGNDTNTALSAERAKSQDGFSLRAFKNGRRMDLTHGRFRDYAPTVAPGGREVYFTTTRWTVKYAGGSHMSSQIARISFGAEREPELVIESPSGNDSGAVQAAVSPDGTKIVWGSLETFWRSWRICGARLSDPASRCFVTPSRMIALTPRWHPGGALICFTGYQVGDPGWCVYAGDVRRGAFARIASGENPCFSPDGRNVCFDRNGHVVIAPFDFRSLDFVTADEAEKPVAEGRMVWRCGPEGAGKRMPLVADGLSFGADRTFYLTVRGVWNGTGRELANVAYEENGRAFALFLDKENKPTFSSRVPDGGYEGVALGGPLKKGERFVLTGVRHGDRLAISLNGAPPSFKTARYGFLAINRPESVSVCTDASDAPSVESVEIGSGWPRGVPKPLTREEVFR